jgi:hypothetical protein
MSQKGLLRSSVSRQDGLNGRRIESIALRSANGGKRLTRRCSIAQQTDDRFGVSREHVQGCLSTLAGLRRSVAHYGQSLPRVRLRNSSLRLADRIDDFPNDLILVGGKHLE